MKIFLSFLQSDKTYPIPAYSFWSYYIKNGIEEAGHQWVECPAVDWALGLVPKSKAAQLQWKEEAWGKTVSWLKTHPVDLFLSYLYPNQIDNTAIAEIKKMGIACVNFFCDNVREFTTIPTQFGAFDLNWVPEYKAVNLYRAAGHPNINLPMPIWVNPANRIIKPEVNQQVTFIGSKDIQRHLLFEDVVAKSPDLPLTIYGAGWVGDDMPVATPEAYTFTNKLVFQYQFIKQHGISAYKRKLDQRSYNSAVSEQLKAKLSGTVGFEQYNQLTAQSMVTLGVNRYPSYQYPLSQPNTYSRLRDIEAPMLGACYLTEWTDGIDELYETGLEIETYRTVDELIEKAKALQSDNQHRKKLKINGQKRALNDHCIALSLQYIAKTLGING